MHAKITTTITTLVDLDTLDVEHAVSIESHDGLPRTFVEAAVIGAATALVHKLESDAEH